jgi:acetyl esterase/lipase
VSEDESVLEQTARDPDDVLRYGSLPDQVVDLYTGAAGESSSVVIFLHGGFWRQKYDRRHVRPLAVDLVTAGCTVALVEYRRVGEDGSGGWPATFDDVRSAIDAVCRRREAKGRVVVCGHSAGGHLALWAAAQPDLPVWHRTVGLAAVADLRLCDEAALGEGAARALLGGGPKTHPDVWRSADPCQSGAASSQVTLIHALDDAVVPMALSRSYARAHPGTTVLETTGGHFGVIDPASKAWPTVRDALVVP